MHLGFKQTYLTFYGVFKAKSLASVLMVYDTYGMVFSLDNNFEQDFIDLLNKLPLTSLSGQDQTVRAIHVPIRFSFKTYDLISFRSNQ